MPYYPVQHGEYEIKITSKPHQKSRSVNMHELPYGSLSYAAPLTPDKNDTESLYRACSKRLCRVLPTRKDGGIYNDTDDRHPYALTDEGNQRMLDLAAFVDRFCSENLPVLTELPTTKKWIEELSHPQWRKDELDSILSETGGYESGWVPSTKQRQQVKMFAKLEDYPEYKECRGINSRSDYFKVYCGPAFRAIEDVVYKLPYFAKHKTEEEKLAIIRGMDGIVYATDFTAFESHMTPVILAAIECRVYMYMLQQFPDLADNICFTLMGKNVCKTRNGFSVVLYGRRMSGEMCTSLGNGLTNILLALYIAQVKTGDYHNLQGLVEGDDGLFTLAGGTLTPEDYLRLGFTIKMDVCSDACEAGFCQMFFSKAGQYVKNPASVLRNFGWSDSCVGCGLKVRNELLRAKALSLAFSLPHCPILRAVADRALEVTAGSKARFVVDGYHVPKDMRNLPKSEIQDETRVLFAKLYGITIESQISIERDIRSGKDLSEVMLPVWLKLAKFKEMDEMRTLRVHFTG